MNNKKLILVELNEINFELIKKYFDKGYKLDEFEKIINEDLITTKSETEYKFLEPWIQWTSVHTGKEFNEHRLFHLGDINKSKIKQIFEIVENKGYSVGAISPMNASNKLVNASYFVSDPWINTKSDNSFDSKIISQLLSQIINNNSSSKITFKSFISLIYIFIKFVRLRKYLSFIVLIFDSIFKKWSKAIFLDLLIHEIHLSLYKKKKPNFSTVFFNAGAHIQHHYFFNSKVLEESDMINPEWYVKKKNDPILEILTYYDSILNEIRNIKETEVVISTGLSQKPYDRVKYYYRLKDHDKFLRLFDFEYLKVLPRMSRDFLVISQSNEHAKEIKSILEKIKVNNRHFLFEYIKIYKNELFVSLTYPNEINNSTYIEYKKKKINLKNLVSFVAIKNGMHSETGYLYLSKNLKKIDIFNGMNIKNIFKIIDNYFE